MRHAGRALVTVVCSEIFAEGELANDTPVTEWSASRNVGGVRLPIRVSSLVTCPALAVTKASYAHHVRVIQRC